MKTALIISTCIFIFGLKSFATHNRAGEITYKQLGQYLYEITIVTYTKESSASADRCFLKLDYGDGRIDSIYRTNGPKGNNCEHFGESVGGDVKKNIYIKNHSYSGPGTYTLTVEDPNRNADIINISSPSVDLPFYIYSSLVINPFLNGMNNSPVLLNPPIDDACLEEFFIHNPGAFDKDGDSLSYELVPCRGEDGAEISVTPIGVAIDGLTGDLTWPRPGPQGGEYNLAILIKEWRKVDGVVYLVGTVLRDMQVTVESGCTNKPPEIVPIQDLCVIAGTKVEMTIKASDIKKTQLIKLTSTGAPYLVSGNKATFDTVPRANPVSSIFKWETECEHIRGEPYQVSFKAEDNDIDHSLVDYETVRITVIGPKTLNLKTKAQGNSIMISWNPNACNTTVKYLLYRKISSANLSLSPCETGLDEKYGYSLLTTLNGLNSNSFTDDDNRNGLSNGVQYCYRVVAVYPDGSKSIVSDESCAELNRDLPLLTRVSVLETSTTSGKILITWTKPLVLLADGLDTIQFPGVYEYKLYRTKGFNTGLIKSFSNNYFALFNDTSFIDENINTIDTGYTYRIEFYSNNKIVGAAQPASSIFLKLIPNDKQLILTWNNEVPWMNYKYKIYKLNRTNNIYEFFDSSATNTLTIDKLNNHIEYCFMIESFGEYSVQKIYKPLINFSQKNCAKPHDNNAPCSPTLKLEPLCQEFKNNLSWSIPNSLCDNDVVKYKLYRREKYGEPLKLLKEFNYNTTIYSNDSLLNSIAACYVVTAVDSFANESKGSDTLCADNCPEYELPNVFTPNNDGINDFFKPLPGWRFIQDINLIIYNRWGNIVFETTNPYILWNGTNYKTKQNCSDGLYYYICKINTIKLSGIVSLEKTGYIHLFDKKESNISR